MTVQLNWLFLFNRKIQFSIPICFSTGEDVAVRNAYFQNRRWRNPEECLWNLWCVIYADNCCIQLLSSIILQHFCISAFLKDMEKNSVLNSCSLFSFLCASQLYLIYCCSGSHNERMQVACNTQQDLQDWLDLLTKHTHTPAPHTPSYKHQSVCHTVRAEDFFKNAMLLSSLGEIQVKSLISVSASCPLTLALPPDCQSHTAGAQDNCTTLFPTHLLLGQPTATV